MKTLTIHPCDCCRIGTRNGAFSQTAFWLATSKDLTMISIHIIKQYYIRIRCQAIYSTRKTKSHWLQQNKDTKLITEKMPCPYFDGWIHQWMGRWTDRQRDRETGSKTDREIDRETEKQTERQTASQPDRQTDRQNTWMDKKSMDIWVLGWFVDWWVENGDIDGDRYTGCFHQSKELIIWSEAINIRD